MTLEAAMVFPVVFALVIMLLYATFFLYDKCRMTQDLYTAAYRQSIVRGKSTPDIKITASAKGEMAPALLTGTGEGEPIWELKVTMRARKTDPPQSFRRFRRASAIAQQVLGQ